MSVSRGARREAQDGIRVALTQRLILQPEGEANLYGKAESARQLGSGCPILKSGCDFATSAAGVWRPTSGRLVAPFRLTARPRARDPRGRERRAFLSRPAGGVVLANPRFISMPEYRQGDSDEDLLALIRLVLVMSGHRKPPRSPAKIAVRRITA